MATFKSRGGFNDEVNVRLPKVSTSVRSVVDPVKRASEASGRSFVVVHSQGALLHSAPPELVCFMLRSSLAATVKTSTSINHVFPVKSSNPQKEDEPALFLIYIFF